MRWKAVALKHTFKGSEVLDEDGVFHIIYKRPTRLRRTKVPLLGFEVSFSERKAPSIKLRLFEPVHLEDYEVLFKEVEDLVILATYPPAFDLLRRIAANP